MKLKLTAALLLISVLLSGCCYAVDRGGADIAPVTAADTEYTGSEDESGVTMVKTESEDGVCEHSWDCLLYTSRTKRRRLKGAL